MKRATVVIGAAFGDEGKGVMTDYFCRQVENPMVVRFNGGAQAGHTVQTPEGDRHVFHHFGSGTFAGAPTYLGPEFLVNPVAFRKEAFQLPFIPHVFVHPDAPVTTIYDMFVNQKLEESRSGNRHGSCGMGIHETMLRHGDPLFQFHAGDIGTSSKQSLVLLCREWASMRLEALGLNTPENLEWIMNSIVLDTFLGDLEYFNMWSNIADESCLKNYDIIFEGAQGLLLDQDNKRFFPHVTHSHTGLTNVIPIAKKVGIQHLDVVYVTRSYLTRHGAGELPGEDPNLSYPDDTNVHNEWQHGLRFAPMDFDLINEAIATDVLNAPEAETIYVRPIMAVTHTDQLDIMDYYDRFTIPVAYESNGPTHKDVWEVMNLGEFFERKKEAVSAGHK